jgi:chorismate-pyruvate lyase
MSNGKPGLLYPLDLFYSRHGLPLPAAARIPGDEMPQPYRRLLVHRGDMTPTLEAFHGSRIHIRKLERVHDGDSYMRQVLLVLDDTEKPVEFGAIVIHLEQFPPAARELVLGERCPLGTILARHAIEHVSRPQAYLRLHSDPTINAALGLPESRIVYGRRNVHATPDERVLADILEILPPLQ